MSVESGGGAVGVVYKSEIILRPKRFDLFYPEYRNRWNIRV